MLLFRKQGESREVLLVHPGGPFWAKRDDGAWSVPKGEMGNDEEPFAAALREFVEELGSRPLRAKQPTALAPVRQAGGKTVVAFALEGDFDPSTFHSNAFEMEWPPRSGRLRSFPEVDRAAWFTLAEARVKLLAGQRPLIDQLARHLGAAPGETAPD